MAQTPFQGVPLLYSVARPNRSYAHVYLLEATILVVMAGSTMVKTLPIPRTKLCTKVCEVTLTIHLGRHP